MNDETERRTVARREGDPEPGSAGIRFDKTINLTHVLTMLVMLASVTASWSLLDKRLAVLEEARQAQRERDQSQDTLTKDKFQEVRDALAVLTRSVEKVADKLEARK